MKKIEIDIYTIDELKEINKSSYNNVINETRDQLINDSFIYACYDVKTILKDKYNLNIDGKNIYYSISYCQGDGVCFTSNNILSYTHIKNKSDDSNVFEKWIINNLKDDEMLLLLDYLNSGYNIDIVKKSHNYCHAHTCKIDYEYFYSSDDSNYLDKINNFIDSLCDRLFNDVYISICSDIEIHLYGYYDVTDDDVIEFINSNEYYYSSEGVLYN